jgi:TonB family protein
MLIALGVLLVALCAVVIKDWDFWFPPRPEAQDAAYTPSANDKATAKASSPAHAAHDRRATRPAQTTADAAPMTAEADRTTLPDLSVEVVAGNRHTRIAARSSAINLDLSGASGPIAAATPVINAATTTATSTKNRVSIPDRTAQAVTKSVAPDYPMLARQMKVQGAVILQALISREGSIQELQVMSGPGILAAAAQEAVKQWRFKPYFQNGEAVETQAKITVNFTISTN